MASFFRMARLNRLLLSSNSTMSVALTILPRHSSVDVSIDSGQGMSSNTLWRARAGPHNGDTCEQAEEKR